MRQKKIKLSALLLLCAGLAGLQAQEAIPASGGTTSGAGGSVSYTVGQLVYTTPAGTTGSVAQGVQQPFEISIVTELEEAKNISLNCLAYPNPATDLLKLKVENNKTGNLSYLLYDISGKLLENKKMEDSETSISMSTLIPSTYFLIVTDNDKEVKTFRIIKN